MPDLPDWTWDALRQLWSFFAVAIAIYHLGKVSKRIAEARGWRRLRGRDIRAAALATHAIELPEASWYDITLRAHGMVAGALFGLLPLPTLDVITGIEDWGARIVARALFFSLAGALSGQIYDIMKFGFDEIRRKIRRMLGRPSTPPRAPKTADESDPGGEA